MVATKSCCLLIFATLALVVVLLLGACDARIQSKNLESSGGFRVDLVHSESAKSSSRADMIRNLVARSNARVQFLSKKLLNFQKKQTESAAAAASPEDYQSPLTPYPGDAYVMEISVGTPAQKFKAIADTGSDLVWVQSDPCSSCSGTIFHPDSSSTFETVGCSSLLCAELPQTGCGSRNECQYLYEYGSGRTEGTFSKDTIGLGTATGGTQLFPSFAVGCGTQNDGFQGAEGLVGLGQGPVSLTSQLSSQIDQKFSYCLVGIHDRSASSPLFFGNAAKLSGSGIQSTPILRSDEYPETFYLISVTGISIAGSSIGTPGTMIIDSGTTLTYVPDSIYQDLLSTFDSLITLPKVNSKVFDLCYDISSDRNYKFPSLTLTLEGATLTPPSSNYFLAVDDSSNILCLAMGSKTPSILGNVMQQGYHILYDRGSSTLSFVKENCESLK